MLINYHLGLDHVINIKEQEIFLRDDKVVTYTKSNNKKTRNG